MQPEKNQPGPNSDETMRRLREELASHIPGYEILNVIRREGMNAIVYKAIQLHVGRNVALKVLQKTKADESPAALEEAMSRFRREIEKVGKLSHPNILPLYEAGETEHCIFYSMKLVEQGSLDRRLTYYSDHPVEAASLMVAVVEAVAYAHKKGIIHRDLAPGNILIDEDKTPYVIDFGLALEPATDKRLTEKGLIFGTPGYVAREDGAPEADIFGLGSVFYAMLTGVDPPKELKKSPDRSGDLPPDALDRKGHIPVRLKAIVRKCRQPNPAERYRTAADLALDLRAFLESQPPPTLSLTRKILLCFVVLAVLVAILVSFQRTLSQSDATLKSQAETLAQSDTTLKAQAATLGQIKEQLGTPADMRMFDLQPGNIAYYADLIPLIEQAAKADDIYLVSHVDPDGRKESEVDQKYKDDREKFNNTLMKKAKDPNGPMYHRIVCFKDGAAAGKIDEHQLPWSFAHCKELFDLQREHPERCRLTKAHAGAIGPDILVIGTRVAVVTLSSREPNTNKVLRDGILIFHNPPNLQIIEELQRICKRIEGDTQNSVPVSSIP